MCGLFYIEIIISRKRTTRNRMLPAINTPKQDNSGYGERKWNYATET